MTTTRIRRATADDWPSIEAWRAGHFLEMAARMESPRPVTGQTTLESAEWIVLEREGVPVAATSFSAGFFNGTTSISTFTGGTANSLTTGGFVQIGSSGGQNVIYDFAGIQSRNAGAAFALALQPLGGNVTVGGAIEATSNASTQSFVAPIYTASGAAIASTAHIVTGTTTLGTITVGSDSSVATTLSGAAAFTSGSTYTVVATVSTGLSFLTGGGLTLQTIYSSGTSFSIVGYNNGANTFAGVVVNWIAIGT